jgi:hypothetical protein
MLRYILFFLKPYNFFNICSEIGNQVTKKKPQDRTKIKTCKFSLEIAQQQTTQVSDLILKLYTSDLFSFHDLKYVFLIFLGSVTLC